MNPLKNLQILTSLIPTGAATRGAGKGLSPLQINFAIGRRKCLQANFFFSNKTSKMTPAVQIVNFCQRGNRMIRNQIINPIMTGIFRVFANTKAGSFSRGLCTMERVIDSVTSGLRAPLSSFGFIPDEEPRGALFNVRVSHGHIGNIRPN